MVLHVSCALPKFKIKKSLLDSPLIYVYKMLFGLVDLNSGDFFAQSLCSTTRGHN